MDIYEPAVSSIRTFQDTDDPNSVILLLEVYNMDQLQKMVKDTGNQEIRDKKE